MAIFSYKNIGLPLDITNWENVNTNFQNLGKDMSNVQSQIDVLVVEGDSSPEAAQARVGAQNIITYPSLKARIDAEINTTYNMLNELEYSKADATDLNQTKVDVAKKADGAYVQQMFQNIGSMTPKGVYATLPALQTAFPTGNTNIYIVTADGKWYYWNGTAWTAGGVYQGTAIADKGVTPVKTSFFDYVIQSNNLFNATTITAGKYARSDNGTLATLAGYNASDYIELTPGETYIRSFGEQFAFYDASKVFVSGVNGNADAPFTVPTNAKYARFSIKDSQLPNFRLNKGTTLFPYDTFKDAYLMKTDFLAPTTDASKLVFTVDQSGNGHYKSIKEAITKIKAAGYTQKITLLIYPGDYVEVLDMRQNSNISLVGINKETTRVIDKSGNYVNSPLMLSGSAYIRNLTFIANHDDNPTLNGVTTYSYAAHIDYSGSGKMLFENCVFESYQNAAVGIGMHSNQLLIFKNCDFYKDGAYNGGSFYAHNNEASGVLNQRLRVENGRIISKQGRALSITDPNIGRGDGLGNDMEIEFINTLVYSEELGKNSIYIGNTPTVPNGICGSIRLSRKSYNNNITSLNV